MKKIILLTLALVSFVATAQISLGGMPTSFIYKKQKINLPNDYRVESIAAPSLDLLKIEDAKSEKNGKPYRAAVNVTANYSINSHGTWTNLPDGSKMWRLGIKIENAEALGIYFSESLVIPAGGKLHAYNANHSQFIGAYNHETDGFIAMEMIQGDEITLEYVSPGGLSILPTIEIGQVAYFYRGVGDRIQNARNSRPVYSDRADACQVDVACSEITGWEPQRDAVVKYTFMIGTGTFLCSGAIVNNTGADCKPYVLTANHCGEPTSSSDISAHVWYFNYQRPSCDAGNTSPYNGAQSQTMSGGFFRASSELGTHLATNNNQVSGSDFALLELADSIPSAYNPFYAGWSKASSISSSGVGIHHPSGDEKKISTYTTSLASDTYNGGWSGAHWEVFWAQTTNGHGVTEGGSSGSPIFNSTGKIVGHLSGGSSFCADPSNSDLYGKFNRAWSQDGSNISSRLQPWLDPTNSNVTELDGSYSPCPAITSGYCEASSVDCDEYISNVSIGGISNPTQCTNYMLYWDNDPLELTKASSYILQITTAIIGDTAIGYTGDQIAAWIDWNADGDFDDAGELVYTHTINPSSTSPLQNLITVPNSAAEEEVRMRVRITYDISSDGPISPCGISNFGEVEDYTLRIVHGALSINGDLAKTINLFPNPTSRLLNITSTKYLLKEIVISDLTGKIIYAKTPKSKQSTFDMSTFSDGLYIVTLKTENTIITKKVVVGNE